MSVQVQKLHLDVGVQGVTVDFCGNSQVTVLYRCPASASCSTDCLYLPFAAQGA